MKKRRVVITGLGVVSCFGTDVTFFYDQLLKGVSGVKPITSFDVSSYSTQFAAEITEFSTEGYIEKKLARRVDPFIQYAIVAGKKALEDSGLQDNFSPEKTGVIIGSGMGGMSAFEQGAVTVEHHGYRRLTPFFVPSIITNMAGGMLAIDCGFTGPNYSISTACATANYSILAAAEKIQYGLADVMVTGGTEAAINPIGMAGFMSMKALSTRNDDPMSASRPWDQNRDGFVMGEGSGILILEELEAAKKRGAKIYAEFLGGYANCDAYHITTPRPDGKVVQQCIEGALKNAHVVPTDVHYVNAHATSTKAGDLCEVRALQALCKDHTSSIAINSTKSLIGHTLGAAGALEAVATILAVQTGKIHPTRNLDNPEPECAHLELCKQALEKKNMVAALSNSFGFGGHNSTLVFGPYA